MPNLNSSIGSCIMRFARLNFTARARRKISALRSHCTRWILPILLLTCTARVESTVVLYGVIRSDGSIE